MAWSGEQSAYDKLYDRLFSVYGQNPDDIGIGETQPNFEANYVDNLAQQMGGDYDQWSNFLTGDHGGTFDPKDYFRGVLNAYFSDSDDPNQMSSVYAGNWNTLYETMIKNQYMSGYKDLGYWQSGEYGQESLGKMEYRGAKESALEKALGTSKKYQQQIGKAGFAGGSKGGILGQSSMWDEYSQKAEDATDAYAQSQRSAREGWLDALLSGITSFSQG